METVKLKAQVTDGKVRLEFPCHLPPGPAEVFVTISSLPPDAGPPYDIGQGVLAGLLPDVDVDEELEEIKQAWKSTLDL